VLGTDVEEVRKEAVECATEIALNGKEPCPLAVVKASLDYSDSVRDAGGQCIERFKTFAPRSLEFLLEEPIGFSLGRRLEDRLIPIGIVGRKDERALKAIEKAMKHEHFFIRYDARYAKFSALDDFDDYLRYIILVQESADEKESADRVVRVKDNLRRIGAASRVIHWTNKRPDDLARALLKLTKDPAPSMRRGATRLISASAVHVDWPRAKPIYEVTIPGDNLIETLEPNPNRPIPQWRSKASVRLLELGAEKRLKEIRDGDPDPTVRAAAERGLKRYEYAKTLPNP